jgi:uncharacterized alkaline shock family protein YloU
MDTQSKIGRITIAPEVIETTARLTTLAIPGVARLVSPVGMRRLLRQDGVHVEIVADRVRIRLYVVTEPRVNMLAVGHQIQAEVTRVIRDMVGMEVQSVDVYIEDVTLSSEEA